MAFYQQTRMTAVMIFAALFALLTFTVSANAKPTDRVTSAHLNATLSKLPEKERLAVMVYAEHTSNQYLAAIAHNNRKNLGSIDEVEELRLAVQKNKMLEKIQNDNLPGKFGSYYTDWIKTLSGYLSGSVTFQQFRNVQKQNDKKLEAILKSEFTADSAKKLATKHKKLIEKISTSFYKPAIQAVYQEQIEDLRKFAKSNETACMPVDKKSKNCGLTNSVKGLINKMSKIIDNGRGRIYRTLRIGDKFVVYVVMQKTKKELKESVKKILKKQPTALEATYTILTMRSLCADKNFQPILKKTNTSAQIVLHSRDLLPIFNLRFKNCGNIKDVAIQKS